ncbi:hypothetical protein FB451DRAFT_1341919 [Mycena latifolia]|nr:hypothetical protein FB451DRAFT_1341919 [Mycena latifolia]
MAAIPRAIRPLFVVAGVGNAAGTGAAAARIFSKAGYSVALIARGQGSLNALRRNQQHWNFSATFESIRNHFPASQYSFRAALFNVGYAVWKPFLEVTPDEVQESLNTNVAAAFSFSREAILKFKENTTDAENPNRGTLIFTGATASMRGNTMTSAFSIGKFGARGLSQSLAKEFGKDDIHAIIDGRACSPASKSPRGDNPPSGLSPESIAQKSAWTWELDLRPAHEKW